MNGKFEFLLYNIDKGCAAWVSTPGGANLMFDIGRNESFSPLIDVYNRGVRSLDAVFISHPHVNHFNDIEALRYFNVARFFRLKQTPDASVVRNGYLPHVYDSLLRRYMELHQSRPLEYGRMGINAGVFNTRDGVVVELFQPQYVASNDVKDYGLVAVVSYNGVKLLLSGDNGPRSWLGLLQDPRFLNAIQGVNVFLTPCHGTAVGWENNLAVVLKPNICLASNGNTPLANGVSAYSECCTGKDVKIRGLPSFGIRSLTTSHHGNIYLQVSWERDMFGRYTIETF